MSKYDLLIAVTVGSAKYNVTRFSETIWKVQGEGSNYIYDYTESDLSDLLANGYQVQFFYKDPPFRSAHPTVAACFCRHLTKDL